MSKFVWIFAYANTITLTTFWPTPKYVNNYKTISEALKDFVVSWKLHYNTDELVFIPSLNELICMKS